MSKCKYFYPGYSEEEARSADYCYKLKEHLPCCPDCKKGKYTVELSWKQIAYLLQALIYCGYDMQDDKGIAKIVRKLKGCVQ